MKNTGITLLLLAMVFSGCNKIKNQFDNEQIETKSTINKTFDSKADSIEADTSIEEQTVADTSSIGLYNFGLMNNFYPNRYQYPLYSPLKLDTTLNTENLSQQYQGKNVTETLWSIDSLTFSYNNQNISDLYNRSN